MSLFIIILNSHKTKKEKKIVTYQSNIVSRGRECMMWQYQVSLLDMKSLNTFIIFVTPIVTSHSNIILTRSNFF